MSNYDELISVLKDLLVNRFAPKPSYVRGLLGDGQGNVTVPKRPDKSYVRFNRGSNEFFEVFNRTVNPVHDWPVLIGSLPWQPGLTQVVDTDWSAFEQSGWGNILGSTSPHAPTHEWPDKSPGSDPLDVYMRAIVPLRAYMIGSGTTTVYVNDYEYEYQSSGHVWPGVPGVDMSPVINSMPTGTMRFMGLYLNPGTNSLGVITGATTVFTSAFDPPRVQFPAGNLPVARIRVYGSQTGITEADIRDARQPFLPASTGTASGAPSGPAGGDLTGTYPNPLVSGLFGYPLVDTVPAEGYMWMFSGSAWRPVPISIGGNVWPKAGQCGISDTQYPTWAGMITALGANEQGIIGEGSYTTDWWGGERLAAGADLRGCGIDVSVLTDSDMAILQPNGTSVLQDFSLINTRTDGGYGIYCGTGADISATNVSSVNTSLVTGTYRTYYFYNAAGTLTDCFAEVSGADTNLAVYAYNSTINIFGGEYIGDVYADNTTGTTIYLYGPKITGSITAVNGATIVGWYYDANGNFHARENPDPIGHTHSKLVSLDGVVDDAIAADADGYLSAAVQPLFSAYLSATVNFVTGDGTTYTVVCDTEIKDRNENYNNATGIFTAPVDGYYLLCWGLDIRNIGVAHTLTYHLITTSNRIYLVWYGNPTNLVNGGVFIRSGSLIADMDSGDTAILQTYTSGGTKTISVFGTGAAMQTYFQGNLLI